MTMPNRIHSASFCRLVLVGLAAGCVSLLATLTACDRAPVGRAPVGPAMTVSDSAGAEIVDFDLDQIPAAGVLTARPNWAFGESTDRPLGVPLSHVREARLLSDGRIAVINGVAEEILVVDPRNGQWVSLAGKGEGPGEARFIIAVWEGDRGIWVHDLYRKQVMQFEDGEYVGSWRPPPDGVPGPLYPEMIIPDGDGFYMGDLFVPEGVKISAAVRRLLLAARVAGEVVDILAITPGDTGTPRAFDLEPLPFGSGFAMVKGSQGLWLGDSAFPELRLLDRQGELLRIIRWRSSQDRRLTQRRIDRTMSLALEGKPRPVRARIRSWWRNTPFPDVIPAWERVISGIDGSLWISEYPGPEVEILLFPYPQQTWWGINADGRPIGTLLTPKRLKVTGFAKDYLIGVYTDEMDVETVVRYGIENVPPISDAR